MAMQYGEGALRVRFKGPYGSVAILGTAVSLPQEGWRGGVSPYHQEIDLPGVTMTSKVDLQPDVAALEQLRLWGTALAAENEDGVVRIFAFGGLPQGDLTMQATITEVQQ